MTEKDFFYYILNKTKRKFKESPIYFYQKQTENNWNYAVCETPIQKEKGVLFGLNWGGNNINVQSEYPKAEKERKWNFLNNTNILLKEYLHIDSIDKCNYSNLCFFRSPNIKYLVSKDWELSYPLFREYIEFINPPFIILLGKTGLKTINKFDDLKEIKKVTIQGKNKKSYGYKGIYIEKIPFFCVPHPQARIESQSRIKIWENLFNSFKK